MDCGFIATLSRNQVKAEALNRLIESTLTILNHKISQKRIQVSKQLNSLPMVKCHAGKINQVFVNIIDNAIDAMDATGILTISTYYHQLKGSVSIQFEDTGTGMDETTIDRIFDPFFTTKEVGKGTGLGMAISYGIIEDHRGQIKIESVIHEGTTITIHFASVGSRRFPYK